MPHPKQIHFLLIPIVLLLATKSLQSQITDSLIQSVRSATEKDKKTDGYYNLLLDVPDTEAVYQELKQEMNDHCEAVECDYCRGRFYYALSYKEIMNGNYDESFNYAKQAAEYFNIEREYRFSAYSYIQMSISLQEKGQYEKSLEEGEKYLNIIKQSKNSEAIGIMSTFLGKTTYSVTGDIEKSLSYFEQAEPLIAESDNQEAYAVLLFDKGSILLKSDIQRGIEILEQADSIATTNSLLDFKPYVSEKLVSCYLAIGQSQKAINICLNGLAIAKENRNKNLISRLNLRLGDLYQSMNNKSMASKHYNDVIKQCAGDQNFLAQWASAEHGLGMITYEKSKRNGLKHLETTDSIVSLHNINSLRIQTLPTLARAYLELGELQKGKKVIDTLIRIAATPSPEVQNDINFALGTYHFHNKEYKKSIDFLEPLCDSTNLSVNYITKGIITTYLTDAYTKLSNYKKAYEWQKEYIAIQDSLVDMEHQQYITTTKLNAEFDKEKQVIELQNEKEKSVLKIKQQRTAAIGFMSFLGLLAGFFFYRSLKKRTKLIESQKSKLETLNNTKDTLFQIIGHDLKKPTIGFRNVSNNINYLLEREDYERLKRLGEEVDQDAKSLYDLTDNLLAWALVQKDAINLKPSNVNAAEIANNNLDLFEKLAKQKNISLVNNIDTNCQVSIDRNALDTVIRNLIDNAIKFTPSGGTIILRSKKTDGMQRLYIEDTGIGMSTTAIDQILNESKNTSSDGTNGEKGSGLGLQLVKGLVNKSHGKFSIKKKSEKGIVISLDLPQAV